MKRHGHTSDMPKEGYHMKVIEALISPSESEIESHIANAEPYYIEQIRKGIHFMKSSSLCRLMSSSSTSIISPSQEYGRKKSKKDSRSDKRSVVLADAIYGGADISVEGHSAFIQKQLKNVDMSTTVRDLFGMHIKPFNLLDVFHSYNADVLTGQELLHIEEITETYGAKEGAFALYDSLQKYDGWLKTVTDVLRDPQVDMKWLADLLLAQAAVEKAANQIFNDPANQKQLADIMKSTLEYSLQPLKILHLFHKYDPSVLIQADIDEVAKITRETNDQKGTHELIDRLVKYHGWEPCLMSVLRDVGLEDLAKLLSNTFMREFGELKKAQKNAQKKIISQMKKYKRLEDAERLAKGSSSPSESPYAIKKAKKEAEKIEALKAKNAALLQKELEDHPENFPRYKGLDGHKKLGHHTMDTLPLDGDLCDQTEKLLSERDFYEARYDSTSHQRMLNPWLEGQKYVQKYDIAELLTFMLSGVIMHKPNSPIDFLIDMSREINRLDDIRRAVDRMAAEKKEMKLESSDIESLATINEQEDATENLNNLTGD